jgi:hypothetical protein
MSSSVPKTFNLIRARGASLIPALDRVKLRWCKLADQEHDARWRQFMHYGHEKSTICYAEATEDLDDEYKVGLIAHELGHAAAELLGFWRKHSETDANRLGSAILGGMVRYRGEHKLEWAEVPLWLAETPGWRESRRRSARSS